MTEVRTRFAPSPTGFLHVGGIRTALFAYLVARQAKGKFVLRLEDTDKNREVAGSDDHILASLKSLGITHDEGPDIDGPYAPYKQSNRLDIYQQWAQKLIKEGKAYADPYTTAEIQDFRDQAQTAKRAFRYRDHRPENPPVWDGTTPLRFKSDPKSYTYHDEVMGDITTSPEVIDDFILIKSDGYPTYNFAHIVDDAEMHITHIIRGQEFLSSMPNYLALYEALGFDVATPEKGAKRVTTGGVTPGSRDLGEDFSLEKSNDGSDKRPLPIFAHMPHILNEQGNKKLGKRDGAKDVLDYIRDGYLPEALDSFIATMGWNDGSEQEVFTMEELIERFSLKRVQKSGARFDEKRLLWMNGHFIRELSLDELSKRVEFFWPEAAKKAQIDHKLRILRLAQDRLKTLRDLAPLTSYFFEEPTPDQSLILDNKQLQKLDTTERARLLQEVRASLQKIETWNAATIQDCLNKLLVQTSQKPSILFSLVRIVTTWAPFSPQLDETLEILGKDVVLARIDAALAL